MMRRSQSQYLFAFFALFVIFADEMFLSYLSLTQTVLESGMRSIMARGIAIVGYILMIIDIFRREYTRNNRVLFFVLFIILVFYLLTSLAYYPPIHQYWAELLVYGSMCIPACYIGMRLARGGYDEALMKLLPLFVIVVTVFVGRAAVATSMQGAILGQEESGIFNYQSASYFLSFSYAYAFLFVFFNKGGKRTQYDRLCYTVMILCMLACAVGCLVGGGRGAFVYLVSITLYLIIRLIIRGGKGNYKYLLLLLLAVGLMVYLVERYDVLGSAGFFRVRDQLTSDDVRVDLWKKAMIAFRESPVFGNGLGSVWWTVGFRSHNLFADLLAESGIIGTTLVSVVLVIAITRLIKWSRISVIDLFVLVLFLGTLVNDLFSGYWIASYKLFLVIGYVYSKKRLHQKENM